MLRSLCVEALVRGPALGRAREEGVGFCRSWELCHGHVPGLSINRQ